VFRRQAKTIQLGLTGGIGSGKSTVAGLLIRRGAVVVDADAISREVTSPGGSAINAIAVAFGREFIQADGAMSRDRMRSIVFNDPDAKAKLEQIVHPIVGQEIQRQVHLAVTSGARCIVMEIPLLVESGRWRALVHRVLTVDCSIDDQVRRVVARSGLAPSDARRIIAAQAPREQRLHASDLVVQNGRDSMSDLETQVEQVADYFGL
jgi:dephospho-CoA kinase